LGIKVLRNPFVGNTNYWENQKLGKEYFGSPALGKKALGKTTFRKKKGWEKRVGKSDR